jgi:hypothetical protein
VPRDLRVFTTGEFQLIFDPSVVKAVDLDSMEVEVKAGHLAGRAFGHGQAFFRVFLEGEVVPRSMEKRAGTAAKGVLEVPSGRLHFAPFEALAKPGGELELTPGRYEITLREMEWGELVEALAERASRKASPSGSKVSDVLGLMSGGLVLLTGIGGIAALIGVLNSGWTAWSAAWPWLLGFAAVLGVSSLLWKAWPGVTQALAAREAIQERFPTTLVQLRKLADGEGPSEGCLLDDHL